MNNPPTINFIIGCIAAVIVGTVLVGLLIYCAWRIVDAKGRHISPYDISMGGRILALIGTVLLTIVVAGAFAWGFYPYDVQYHSLTTFEGTIADVGNRLYSPGENQVEQKFVVRFTNGPAQYGVLDTRMATAKPGDDLKIQCVRVFQWGGSDGWDCYFTSLNGQEG